MDERLFAYRCQHCDELHYPRHFVCRRCGGKSFNPLRITGECELVTWTRLHFLAEGFREPSLTLGIVRYPNGLKVAGQLRVSNPKIGMRLETTVGPIRGGDDAVELGFIFTEQVE